MAFRTLELDVTTRCNLACSYCYKADRDAASRGRDMPVETASKALAWFLGQAAGPVKVNFMGAEPLMNVDLMEQVMAEGKRLAALHRVGISFGGATNATLIDARVLALVREGLRLNLSLDGCREAHDACRVFPDGSGSFDAVMAGAGRYLAVRPAEVRLTVRPETVSLLPASLRELRTLVAEIAVEPDYSAEWDAAALERLGAAYREAASLYVLAFASGAPFYLSFVEKGIRAWLGLRRADSPCGAGRGLISLDVDGRFRPCHRFSGVDAFDAGDLEGGINEAALEPFRSYRARFDARAETECAQCPAVILCKGGCPAANFAATGDTRRPPASFCAVQRVVAAESLRAMYLLSHDPDSSRAFERRFRRKRRGRSG